MSIEVTQRKTPKRNKETKKKVPWERVSKYKRREIRNKASKQFFDWLIFLAKRFNPLICACAVLLFVLLAGLVAFVANYLSYCEPVALHGDFALQTDWTGAYEVNNVLWETKKLLEYKIFPPSSLSLDEKGNLYVGMSGGTFFQIKPGQQGIGRGSRRVIATGALDDALVPEKGLPGNPVAQITMGIFNFTFVLDQHYGLYTVHHKGHRHQFVPIMHQNFSQLIAPTDMARRDLSTDIYIVDMSTKWGPHYLYNQILEGTCTGRLIKFDLATSNTTVLLDGLCAPVGVDFINQDSMIAIAEAGKARIRIIEFKTMKTEKFVKLPGIPGRLSKDQRGGLWLPIRVVNHEFFKFVGPRPWLRKLMSGMLPESYLEKLATVKHSLVAELGADLDIVVTLHDSGNVVIENIDEVIETESKQLLFASSKSYFIGKLGEM